MVAKIKIAEAFSQVTYSSFIEYCNSCNYIFLDELTPVDFIAYKTKYDVDPSFVKQLKRDVRDFEGNVLSVQQNSEFESVTMESVAAPIELDEQVGLFGDDKEASEGTVNSNIEENSIHEDDDAISIPPNNAIEFTKPVEGLKVENLDPVLDSMHPIVHDRVPFIDSIYSLNLSVRSTNALIKNDIKTILQLMEVDRRKLSHIKNLGVKSINEILKKIAELEEKDLSVSSVNEFDSDSTGEMSLSSECRDIIKALLLNETEVSEIKNLSAEEMIIVENVVNAIDDIGGEISLEAYTKSNGLMPLMASLKEFSTAYEEERELLEIYRAIPHYRRCCVLSNYIKAFRSTKAKNAQELLKPFLQPQLKVSDLKNLFVEVCKKKNSKAAMIILLQLLHTDLKQVFTNLLDDINPKYERPLSVLRQRCVGLSLESIGNEIGVTRERVRQLEKKAMNVLRANIAQIGIDLIMFIYADTNADTILTVKEVTDYIGDFPKAELVMYWLQKQNGGALFAYDSDRKLFHLKDMIYNVDQVEQIVAAFPKIIFYDKVANLLSSTCIQFGVSLKILRTVFKGKYNISGQVCHRGKLTVSAICEVILKTYYPSGIKLYDETEEKRFREKVKEVFGNVNFSNNTRAFNARLVDVAVLCERGMYIHPSYIQIPNDLVQKIDDYISCSERTALSFNELFETFKDELLLSSNISNHYFLQGVLHYCLKDKYYFTKDLISKEKNANLGDAIEEFIRERGEVHKAEIISEFLGITDIMLSLKVNGKRDIISLDNGQYMHSDLLNLRDEDYTIRKIIEVEVRNLPVSSRKLLEQLWVTYADFLTRNDIMTHSKLFGILRYMFDGEFSFSRPYIAKLGTYEITNLSVIKQHLQDYDRFSISELISICTENHLQLLSVRRLIQQLNNEFLRTYSDILERIEDSLLTDEALNEIANMLLEGISGKGYIVADKIDNYIFYPDIGFSWNAFLLRSVVEKYFSENIRLIDMPTTDIFAMNTIFVDSALDVDNYEELLSSVLKSEHDKERFLSIDDVLNWLQGEGLILSEPPKCLTEGRIVCVDEYGEIIIN